MNSTEKCLDKAFPDLIKILEQAGKFDSWGQRLEAAEAYEKFCKEIKEARRASIDQEEQSLLELVISRIEKRGQILHQPAITACPVELEEVTLQQIKTDIDVLKETVRKIKRKKSLRRKLSVLVMKEIKEGGLLPPPRPKKPGYTYLTIKIDKIGLKDAMTYVEPFVTVSLKDDRGVDVTPAQSTPPAELYEKMYIIFSEEVHIQSTVEEIRRGWAIFFELKHYKAKKDKISTKCFAFLEKDEIKNGPLALELYQKPVDYTRKKISLLTEKNLFLHVVMNLEKVFE